MQDLVTVFGGSGFVGSQVVRSLAKQGLRVRVAVRRPHLAGDLRLLGDVGQIQIVQANIRDEASVRRALAGAQACVNLVAVLFERGRQKFRSLHAEGAELVAREALAAGCARLVQVSALGADPKSPSLYGRTKAAGEEAVRRAFPHAVIVRPSLVFGPEDDFFNRFAAMATLSPALPLIGGGKTRVQPVYVGDVGRAVARMAIDPACSGRTYELGGPEVITFKEVMQLVADVTQRRRLLLPIPYPVAGLIGTAGDLIAAFTPFPPPLTTDQVRMLKTDNVADQGLPGLIELGITPTALEPVIETYLYRYRRGGQYAEQAPRAPAI